MKKFLSCLLAMGLCSTSIVVTPLSQQSWGQTQIVTEVKQSSALNLVKQGEQELQQKQPQKAFETFQEALKLAQKIGDRYAEGEALNNIGFMYEFWGQHQKALDIYNQTLIIRREINDRKGEGITLNNIGEVYFRQGQFEKADTYLNQALTIFQEIENADLATTAMNNIETILLALQQEVNLKEEELKLRKEGIDQIKKEQYQESLKTYEKLLDVARQLQHKETEAAALRMLGLANYSLKHYQKALDYYLQVLPLDRELGDQEDVVNDLNYIGSIYNYLRQDEKAIKTLQESLRIAQKINYQDGELNALLNLALSHEALFQHKQALDNLNQALFIQKNQNNLTGQISVLNYIGSVYQQMGKPQDALTYLNQSLSISQQINDSSSMATALDAIGSIYDDIGQRDKALEYLKQALSIRQENNDLKGMGDTLNKIGIVFLNYGQYKEAWEYFSQALSIRREVKDRLGEAVTLGNIGSLQRNTGEFKEALKNYNQALHILEGLNDKSKVGDALNGIGSIYDSMSQYQKALDYYNQVLKIRQNVGDLRGKAVTLGNIGGLYAIIGQTQKGLISLTKALEIHQKVGDRNGEATAFNNIGMLYTINGDFHKALENLSEALSIYKEVKDRSGEIVALHNIGVVHDEMGKPQKALEIYNQALELEKNIKFPLGQASILEKIGIIYGSLQDYQEALNKLNQALSIYQRIGVRYGEASTLTNLGFVYRDTNQLIKAIDSWEKSANISLEMRKGFQRKHRSAFLQSDLSQVNVIALIDLLIKQGKTERAFEWANLVTTSELAHYSLLIDAKVSNPKAQEAIDEWTQKNYQVESLRQQLQNPDQFSEEKAQKLRTLEAQMIQQAEKMINRFLEIAELFETKPKDIKQLQKTLQKGTVLIQPVFLTDGKNVPSNVAIFVATHNSLKVVQQEISAAQINQLMTEYRSQLQNHRDSDYKLNSHELYNIFIQPIEKLIEESAPQRLAILATGKLRYIPVETLYDGQKYLLEKYPIHYITRLSTHNIDSSKNNILTKLLTVAIISGISYWIIRKLGIVRGSVLVFIVGVTTFLFLSNINSKQFVKQKALAFANPKPTRTSLPGTEAETKKLTEIFPGSQAYYGTEATLSAFKIQASRFSFLHLGTHGCFKPNGCPNLGMDSNTILFANNEQYNISEAALLGLKNTELITLSACETAKEANVDGQEISGLAYVFERAGAKSIIASLFSAEDEASKEIMIKFYQNVKSGVEKSEAMQQAKLSQIHRHPYFWSPFILIGDGL